MRLRHGQPALQRGRRVYRQDQKPGGDNQTGRLPFGLPGIAAKSKGKKGDDSGETVSNANSLWIQYFYSYLNQTGRAGFVMASSASDAGNKDKEIRQKLVDTGHVDVMVAIGPKFLYTRSLPCTLWFFDKGKPQARQDTVLMIDARNHYTVVSARSHVFTDEQLANLTAITWLYRGEQAKFTELLGQHQGHALAHLAAIGQRLADDAAQIATLSAALRPLAVQVGQAETVAAVRQKLAEAMDLAPDAPSPITDDALAQFPQSLQAIDAATPAWQAALDAAAQAAIDAVAALQPQQSSQKLAPRQAAQAQLEQLQPTLKAGLAALEAQHKAWLKLLEQAEKTLRARQWPGFDGEATGADGLEHLLRDQDRRYVFSLIHKFHKRVTAPWTERRDIIVLSDEAHRTQYGRLATQMRMALRHAKFLAFTGTPLIDSRERHETEKVFGAYVSVYDFQRAVADGATLPLYYENRGQKLRLIDPALNVRIAARIDAARADGELTEEQEEKLNRELAREYPVFTSDTHLNDVASDFVEHFHQRWRLMEKPAKPNEKPIYGGQAKAMLVCIDKITCAKMAERIRAKWLEKRDALQAQLHQEAERFAQAGKPEPAFVERLRAQVQWMSDTQIHPVFSPEQNEVKEFAAEKIDVKPLRQVIANGIGGKKLEDCFKDSEHPFRVAVVCAMWLTGFDVKSLATLYLDKPMKGHTLMQAIARVNRVAAHKKNGLVIDYNGMLKSLREALATYGQGDKGVGGAQVDPLVDEDQALADYAAAIGRVVAHLATVGYALNNLVRAEQGEETWGELLKAQRALSHSPETKKTFQVLAEDVFDRYRGLFPLEGLFQYEPQESAISAIYNLLARPKPKVDITAIMQEIRGVIDTSLDVSPNTAQTPKPKQYDLSGIDFERLRAEFAKSPYKEPAVLTLQERIEARLELMMRANPGRVNFYERYLRIISEFNRDKDDAEIQRVFEDLLRLHDSLDTEERRYLREGFTSEKELAVFDLLSKDKADIQKADIEKLKKVAKELMATIDLRRQEMGELRDRASAQARMKVTIIDHLLHGLPDDYSSEDIEARSDTVYQYVQAQVHSRAVH